jgi:hypothetical protein
MLSVLSWKSLSQVRERVDVKVEVLYFKGCPNHKPVIEQVRQVLRSEQINVPVDEMEITDAAMPQRIGFLGSPSIRIDGLDVEPEARGLQTFGFGCRTYSDAEGRRSGLPSISTIRQALTEASTSHATSASTPS